MYNSSFSKLQREFYDRPTLEVAQDLLGKVIVFNSQPGVISSRIVEVEAYIGRDDPACHAAAGLTKRTRPMFGPPGHAYIYLIYGIYYCLNFVTEPAGAPAAVLLRAAEPLEGKELLVEPSSAVKIDQEPLSGPGKFCRAYGLNLDQNDLDLTGDLLYLEDRGHRVKRVCSSPRIGIKVATKRCWRFYDADSLAVTSGRKKERN